MSGNNVYKYVIDVVACKLLIINDFVKLRKIFRKI